jgi:hypothetical protein
VEKRLKDYKGEYSTSELFHESDSQKYGLLTRFENPSFSPKKSNQWIVSGPHIYINNPYYKTCQTACTHNQAYDSIDLTKIPKQYFPESLYRPGDQNGHDQRYYSEVEKYDCYSKFKMTFRSMGQSGNERSFVPTITPPKVMGINAIWSWYPPLRRTSLLH